MLILVVDPQSAILGFLLGLMVGLSLPDTLRWLWGRRWGVQ
jgi:hypothetical protein